ncbi:hypothetical protein [Aeromonas sobria]|uniref:hypothetical protein n=1 Tax=Aeromonas sobria TaxID=646 RepID=UPI003F3B2AED
MIANWVGWAALTMVNNNGDYMFLNAERKKALQDLETAEKRCKAYVVLAQREITSLYEWRAKCSKELITRVESYINRMKNTPIEFDKSFAEFKAEIVEFDDVVEKLEMEYNKSHVGKGTAAVGIAAGAGFAAFAPTAALAVATTFGTASTGTAIATLSGAAATNAALAWLGGGALAAGGGGMSAGGALLALAGPLGWGIGAAGIAGGALLARNKNSKIIEETRSEERKLLAQCSELNVVQTTVKKMVSLTSEHYHGTERIIDVLSKTAPHDYKDFVPSQKQQLASLINHINSLSQLINKKVK